MKSLKKWVEDNPAEFGDKCNPKYKSDIFDRCKTNLYAPEDYLKERLKTLENSTKWFLEVYQIIVFTLLLGTIIYLFKLALDGLFKLIEGINLSNFNISQIINSYTIETLIPSLVILYLYIKREKNDE